ncbi:2-C-methyl-D-erythritol 4-phosphate cytidylyltransferase [Rheinheimera sp. 4Y26]|uniref:2-C-methyl-D-erythritol 4-phosphate cytidylyltransferase n=1 Tax=Rheinheimera sp. 4Y26 TaxID=2977811 RepID=UPI0021B0BF0F|nr:2-C-methyl-D-erythritol 4-phosphate cytidylyltransferase [Rheinheimera sp. 4Y26]MCT6699003.1 2-C-methyl-D-erythritol 4-phosphate cytidylyltransferase [Rheinheimera sp. 4Y26]
MTIAVVIPAAGVGQRMQADRPKQYLELAGKTILEHTVERLRQVPELGPVWLALAPDDGYFAATSLAASPGIYRVNGGRERANSVLAGLMAIDERQYPWVLVHDAARPLVQVNDIQKLIKRCLETGCGGILATPVRDTMKRGMGTKEHTQVLQTVERADLWHALTPQLFPTAQLRQCLQQALQQGAAITDEASALEWAGLPVLLVSGRADNIKITQSEDLQLARFYLEQQ